MGTQSNPPSNLRSKPSFSQYVSVRQRLDDLGYNSYLSNDSVPLVAKLLSDLLQYKDLCSGASRHSSASKQKGESTATHGLGVAEHSNDNESLSQISNKKLNWNEQKYLSQIEVLKLENTKLNEKISEYQFVLDQNSEFIQKLKKDNDTKGLLILKLQNGLGKGETQHQVPRPSIEKDGDLPSANLSKIQALYKRILSASDNPAIIDWVKAAETKISNLERELENTGKALDVSQQTCEQYRKQVFDYENKLVFLERADKNKSAHDLTQLKCRMEQKDRQIKELQDQLSEAVRKQHEAMSRAIMLAGDRPHNREAVTKHAVAEKRVVGLESERNVLKQMLTTTQKERDELMKEVHRLHSHESTLMSEIRNLVGDDTLPNGRKTKNVRFQTNNKSGKISDSGAESSASQEEGVGRNRELWLKQLTEQRQSYYDNVNKLLNHMRNREGLSAFSDQRPSSQQSLSVQSNAGSTPPDSRQPTSQPSSDQSTVYQQQLQRNSASSHLPGQQAFNQSPYPYQQLPLLSQQQSTNQPRILNFQQPNQPPPILNFQQPNQQPQIINFQQPNQQPPVINFQQPNQQPPVINFQQPNQQPQVLNIQQPNQQAPVINIQQPNQQPPVLNIQQPNQQPPIVNIQQPNQQPSVVNIKQPKQQPPVVNIQQPNQPSPVVNIQQPNQPSPVVNIQQPNQQSPITNFQQPSQLPSQMNFQQPSQLSASQNDRLSNQVGQQSLPQNVLQANQPQALFSQSYAPQPNLVQPNFRPSAQYQSNDGGFLPQQQPTFAQPSPQWNAQLQGNLGQTNLPPQQYKSCVCGGQFVAPQSYPQFQEQPGFPQTYQTDSNLGQPIYLQPYQSQSNFDPQTFSRQPNLFAAQGAQMMPTQTDSQFVTYGSTDQSGQQINRTTPTSVQDRRTQTESTRAGTPVYTPTEEELDQLPDQIQTWAQAVIEEKKTLKEKNAELRLELDELTENSQISDSKVNEITDKLKNADELIKKLQTDLEAAATRARASEQGLQVERNNLQQLRLDIDAADGNASALTQKFVEKSTQLDSAKQRCYVLEQNVGTLEDQIISLQNQLQAVQSQNQRPNPAVQKLLEEVEGRNAKIIQLEKQITAKQEIVNQRGNDIETANGKLREMEQELVSERGKVQQLQQDIDNSQNKLKAAERELVLEKNKLQQLQFEIANADSNAAALAKKIMEKSGQIDIAKQRCSELENQVSRLEEQIGGLKGQLRSSQVQRAQGENEQRQLQDELDSCKARIIQLERQSTTKQETITILQSNISTCETKIQFLERENGEKNSQVELNRRTNERLSSEVDKSKIDNAALRQENERLVASLAQFRADLELERQGSEDLRREVQSYISHVRQVESILARKDEEKDALLKQFQHLANETNNFDAERESMERSIRSQQQEVATLQAELTTVRRRLGELEQLYSQQKSAGVQAEMQADDLLRRLGVLERDLRDARGDKVRLEQQLATANDLQQRLEKQLEKLRSEAAQVDSTNHQMEAETTRLHEDMHVLEQRLSKEKESVRNLESIVSILRQERSQQETQMRTMSQDLTRLHHREILLQEELANMKAELCATDGKVADLTRENQRLKQEVLQEKFEREKTRQEMRRLGNLSRTPPLIASYNISPAPPGAMHNLSTATICTPTFPGTAGGSSNTSPRKRVTVAARFANNATQT